MVVGEVRMIFFCIECGEPFEVNDKEIVQAMVYEHLDTGDGFTCSDCQPNQKDVPTDGQG